MGRTKSKKQFDWKSFSGLIRNSFHFFSKYSRVPINADRWEEFIFTTLRDMGETYQGGEPKWIRGSHAPGADVWTDTFAISAKSGALKNGSIVLSSCRLTRFVSLKDMIAFLDGPAGKNFDFYLCCARIETKSELTYQVYKVPAEVFAASSVSWKETKSGWEGDSSNGVSAAIVRKMSNQLWLKVPLALCEKITEFTIPLSDLGATPLPLSE
ncbi:MAG: hypothetical protein WCT45_02420 [Candidatus Paceibacterota bacterium]|jgi:hypothetical protein